MLVNWLGMKGLIMSFVIGLANGFNLFTNLHK